MPRIRLPQIPLPKANFGPFRTSGHGFITEHLEAGTQEGFGALEGEKVFAARTGGRFFWQPPLRAMQETFGDLEVPTIVGARARLELFAIEVERFMKETAPWEDRSGAARESLRAEVRQTRATLSMAILYDLNTLYAQQDPPRNRNYSVFLETMQAGKFAIIGPTIEHFQGQLMLQMAGLWDEYVPF